MGPGEGRMEGGEPPIVKIPMYGDWLGFKHSYVWWHVR